MTHTVNVVASSLYEAALALAAYKRSGFAFASMRPTTKLKVAVVAPSTTHEILVAKFQSWLERNGRTPREQAKKVTLRQLIERE